MSKHPNVHLGGDFHEFAAEQAEESITELSRDLRNAVNALTLIAQPPCPYLGINRESCGRCSTCIARNFLSNTPQNPTEEPLVPVSVMARLESDKNAEEKERRRLAKVCDAFRVVLKDAVDCLEHAKELECFTPKGSTEGWADRVIQAAGELLPKEIK